MASNSSPLINTTDLIINNGDPSSIWEWGNLLDFDQFNNISWSPPQPQPPPPSHSPFHLKDDDPRLSCENFMAGRVPCACPELDNLLGSTIEDDEVGGDAEVGDETEVLLVDSKKRRRGNGAGEMGVVGRCQVKGCEVDISELKGYHKRHRVCLGCANAVSVVIGGEEKRYCQQCGKFHILPDFDEGKRSCRRKLERHNKRRRRKSVDSKDVVEKETQVDHLIHDFPCESEAGKDDLCVSHNVGKTPLESDDGHVSHSPLPPPQNLGNDRVDKVTSSIVSEETQMEDGQNTSKCTISSPLNDTKSVYSSACPTGRISFKLYDWNPAEFPRRLRHQIFQWLSNMPVELEGYIRPGCTILTVYTSMPQFMWDKFSEDAATYIDKFVNSSDCVLFGRGSMVVTVNNMIYQVLKGRPSLMNVKMEVRAPKLNYVYPNYFEAGKPAEFVVCGSNLQQPKIRFLVSFAGEYLAYDYFVPSYHDKTGSGHGIKEDTIHRCANQLYKINIPKTEPKLFGPAFVEVENESGLSNFIPILFGDKQMCSEMQMIQQKCDGRVTVSEILLDVSWLLQESKMEATLTLTQIHRLNRILSFLIDNKFSIILERLLNSPKFLVVAENLSSYIFTQTNDDDVGLFEKYINQGKELVRLRLLRAGEYHKRLLAAQSNIQDIFIADNKKMSETAPLVNREFVVNLNNIRQKHHGSIIQITITNSRPFVLIAVASAALCFGVCVAFIHPEKVGEIAVTMRRCLFNN